MGLGSDWNQEEKTHTLGFSELCPPLFSHVNFSECFEIQAGSGRGNSIYFDCLSGEGQATVRWGGWQSRQELSITEAVLPHRTQEVTVPVPYCLLDVQVSPSYPASYVANAALRR